MIRENKEEGRKIVKAIFKFSELSDSKHCPLHEVISDWLDRSYSNIYSEKYVQFAPYENLDMALFLDNC